MELSAPPPPSPLPQGEGEKAGHFTSLYGYMREPVFRSVGQRITSVFGSLNWLTSLAFTFWNCTSITRASAHSPSGPNFTSPTTVLNVCERR